MNLVGVARDRDGLNVTCVTGADGATALPVMEKVILCGEMGAKRHAQLVTGKKALNAAIAREDNVNVEPVTERGNKDILEDK